MIKNLLISLGFFLVLSSCSKEADIDVYYTLKVVPESGGSVSNNGYKSIAGAKFTLTALEGTNVTITAYPEEGFLFDGWSNGETSNPYSFILDKNINLEAYFSAN